MSSPAPTPGQPSLLNQILPYAVQGGLGLLGNKLAQGPTNQMNAWQRQQYEDALRRRNALQGLALPSMIRALGYSEDKSRGMADQFQASQGTPGLGSAGGAPMNYKPDSSRIGQVAGLAAGVAGTALGGPVGGMISGALYGALGSQFGKGRRTANPFVDQVEDPFGNQLAQISQMAGSNPQEAAKQLQQAEAAYRQQTQGWISKGGEHAKVAQQSLNNPKLWQTVAALKQQLGVA